MDNNLPIIKFICSIVILAFVFGAALIHIANRHSKSYIIALGYLGLAIYIARQITHHGYMCDIVGMGVPCVLLSGGEMIRFFRLERSIYKILSNISRTHNIIWNFEEFKKIPVNTTLSYSYGHITKIAEEEQYAVLRIDYPGNSRFYFEGENSDCIYSSLQGIIFVSVQGEQKQLTPGEETSIKAGTPYQIVTGPEPVRIKLVIMKRDECGK